MKKRKFTIELDDYDINRLEIGDYVEVESVVFKILEQVRKQLDQEN